MITIRSATIVDLPDLLRIYNHAVRHSTATFDLEEQTLEQRRDWFAHYGGSHPLIVAVADDGRIAGYGCLSAFRAKPAYDRTVENSIYLDPEFWGQGIGTRLLQELIALARAHGHHTIIACITAGNDISIRMHEKFGFKLVGFFPEVGRKFGEWQGVTFYQLLLDDE